MPASMKFPENLMIRLPTGTKAAIEALQRPDEKLADTQRRVVLAGLEAESCSPTRAAGE